MIKKRFRILFIDVIDYGIKFQSSYPPLGIGYLISYLQKYMADIEVRVVNGNYLRQLKSFRPDLVALSSVTPNFSKAKEFSREIKKYNALLPIITGGVHVSQIPESMDKNMDVAVIGEGEETFYQLIKHIRNNKNFFEGLENIDGLAFLNENNIIKTKERKAISMLDNIPHPARWALPNKENQLLLTSRGCPYKCAFCSSSHYWKGVRYFSVDYVLEEIRQIIKYYPVLNLNIYDDLFVFDKRRLAEISSRIVKCGYHKKISFWCLARANHIDAESLGYLKAMNIKGIGMGLESGSDKILKMIKSDNVSVEINRRAIELCKKNGIFVHGSFMIGCPHENEDDMLKTYGFIIESDFDKGDISLATPLPGTYFWEYALKERLVSCDMDWSKLAICYSGDLSNLKECLLLTKETSKEKSLEIFNKICSELAYKRKKYDKKWDTLQGKEIKLIKIFSFANFKKFINDPSRAWRYTISILSNIPCRLLSLMHDINHKGI